MARKRLFEGADFESLLYELLAKYDELAAFSSANLEYLISMKQNQRQHRPKMQEFMEFSEMFKAKLGLMTIKEEVPASSLEEGEE